MSFYYHLYGLNVESDLALPGLRSQTAPRNHDSPVKLFLRDALTHWPIETGADESTLIYSSAQNGSTTIPLFGLSIFPPRGAIGFYMVMESRSLWITMGKTFGECGLRKCLWKMRWSIC